MHGASELGMGGMWMALQECIYATCLGFRQGSLPFRSA